jgi:hypothetical protein
MKQKVDSLKRLRRVTEPYPTWKIHEREKTQTNKNQR